MASAVWLWTATRLPTACASSTRAARLLGRVVPPPELFLVTGGPARRGRLEEIDAEPDLRAGQPADRPGPVRVDRFVARPGVRERKVRVPARLPDPAGDEDARARHQPDRDRTPEGQHLEIEWIDGASQVAHGGEARLEHEARVLRGVEREKLGASADFGPDRVRLVGVDDADEVDVEIHEARHDRGAGGVEPQSRPVPEFGRGRHALHAAFLDQERHVSARTGPAPVPEAAS